MATQVGATNQNQPSISPGNNAVVSLSDGRVVRLVWIPSAQVYRLLVTADGVTFSQIGGDISQFFSYYWSLAVDPSDNLYLFSSDGVEGAGGTSPTMLCRSFIKTQSGWSTGPQRGFSSGISGVGIAETRVGWVNSGRAGGHLVALWYSGNWQTAKLATFPCDYLLGTASSYSGASDFLSTGGLQNTSANYFRIAVSPAGPNSNAALVMALNTSSGYLNPNLITVDSGGAITYGTSANLSAANWPQGTSQSLPSRVLRVSPGKWLIVAKSGSSSSSYVAGVITDLSNNPGAGVVANLNSLYGFPVSYAQAGWDAFADPQAADTAWCMAPIESVVNSKSQLRRVKLTVSGTTVSWATSAVDDELITLPAGYSPNVFRAGQQPIGKAQWGADFYSGSANNGSGGYYSVTGQTVFNNPPTAAQGQSPINNQRVDRTQPIRCSWAFSDPDSGDTQSRADFRYRLGTGAWTTITNAATTGQTYDIPANTFAAEATPGWQVLTYDSQGQPAGGSASPTWSSEQFFTASDPTTPPTITAPTAGGTIPTSTFTVTWSSAGQDAYQVRRLADAAGQVPADPSVPANVYSDTGVVEDATARSRTLTFDQNNRAEHVQVRVRKGGLWSSWSSVRATVSYTPPAAPTLALTAVKTRPEYLGTDAIDVAITNPAPTGNQPSVVAHDVFVDDGTGEGLRRVAAGIPAGTTWRHTTPVVGRDYQQGRIRVVAIAGNGTTSATSS